MSLVTRCPKCQSDFMVSLEQLRVHDGLVRCGQCTNIFDGQTSLESALPTLTQRATSPRAHIAQPVVVSAPPEQEQQPSAPSVLRRRAQTGAEFERPPEQSFVAEHPEPVYQEPVADAEAVVRVHGEARLRGEHGSPVGRSTPKFLIDETPLDGLRRWLWVILMTSAALLLLAQLAYVYRNELVTRIPTLLPLARTACVQLKCEVSLVRHLDRITIESTALEQMPGTQVEGQASVLTLKFSIRNRYDKMQPWPHLSVELKDASGTTVIRKVLAPEQYLPQSLATRPFGANQETHLSLPMIVNGLQISGVQLNRFFP